MPPTRRVIVLALAAAVVGLLLPWVWVAGRSVDGFHLDDGKVFALLLAAAVIACWLHAHRNDRVSSALQFLTWLGVLAVSAFELARIAAPMLPAGTIHGGAGLWYALAGAVAGTGAAGLDASRSWATAAATSTTVRRWVPWVLTPALALVALTAAAVDGGRSAPNQARVALNDTPEWSIAIHAWGGPTAIRHFGPDAAGSIAATGAAPGSTTSATQTTSAATPIMSGNTGTTGNTGLAGPGDTGNSGMSAIWPGYTGAPGSNYIWPGYLPVPVVNADATGATGPGTGSGSGSGTGTVTGSGVTGAPTTGSTGPGPGTSTGTATTTVPG
jgi:hypothetical protein